MIFLHKNQFNQNGTLLILSNHILVMRAVFIADDGIVDLLFPLAVALEDWDRSGKFRWTIFWPANKLLSKVAIRSA